ncbi:MAG: hypothetical protein L0287_32270 [Anaerolineae bacterium]|nr:hypothetical protein [Anaerolineae bacterium]
MPVKELILIAQPFYLSLQPAAVVPRCVPVRVLFNFAEYGFGDWVGKIARLFPNECRAPGVGQKPPVKIAAGFDQLFVMLLFGQHASNVCIINGVEFGNAGGQIAKFDLRVEWQALEAKALFLILFAIFGAILPVVAFDWFEGFVGDACFEQRGGCPNQRIPRLNAVFQKCERLARFK